MIPFNYEYSLYACIHLKSNASDAHVWSIFHYEDSSEYYFNYKMILCVSLESLTFMVYNFHSKPSFYCCSEMSLFVC